MPEHPNETSNTDPSRIRKSSQRGRTSPSHTLEDAIDGARRVFNALGTSRHARDDVATAMGYKPGSGAANSKVGSLTHYGLLVRTGAEYEISDLARRILEPHSDAERRQAVAEAATSPSLYAELIQQYDGQPLPGMLSNILSRQYGVVPKNSSDVASRFEASLSYAGLLFENKVYATLDRSPKDEGSSQESNDNSAPSVQQQKAESPALATDNSNNFNIPLRKGRNAVIALPRPVEDSDIDRIKQWLDLMADVLTEVDDDSE